MWATQRVVQAVGAMSMLTPCLSIMQIARVFWKKGIPRLGGRGSGGEGLLAVHYVFSSMDRLI